MLVTGSLIDRHERWQQQVWDFDTSLTRKMGIFGTQAEQEGWYPSWYTGSMSTVHRWLANNPVWVAFAFLATCLALGRLLVGNADLSPANVAIAFVGAYGGWLLAQVVSASYWCSPERIAARRSESREIAMAALSQAKAAIAAQQPRLRNDFPRTATQSN